MAFWTSACSNSTQMWWHCEPVHVSSPRVRWHSRPVHVSSPHECDDILDQCMFQVQIRHHSRSVQVSSPHECDDILDQCVFQVHMSALAFWTSACFKSTWTWWHSELAHIVHMNVQWNIVEILNCDLTAIIFHSFLLILNA